VQGSVVSVFDILIEIGIGKPTNDLAALTDALHADGFQTLPIREHHLLARHSRLIPHRDQFDR
jgi:PIN domain nuclease of toxin-antitoxin system